MKDIIRDWIWKTFICGFRYLYKNHKRKVKINRHYSDALKTTKTG